MTIIPGQDAILATDPGVGFEIYDLSNMGNSTVVPVAGEKAICWSSYSAKTGNFYLSDAGAASIVEISVDKSLRAQVVNVCAAISPWSLLRYITLLSDAISNTNRPRIRR